MPDTHLLFPFSAMIYKIYIANKKVLRRIHILYSRKYIGYIAGNKTKNGEEAGKKSCKREEHGI